MNKAQLSPKSSPLPLLRKIISGVAIGCFVIVGSIAITQVFVKDLGPIFPKILNTLLLLGIFLLLSLNSLFRLENTHFSARLAAFISIFANLIWLVAFNLYNWDFAELFQKDCSYLTGPEAIFQCSKPYIDVGALISKLILVGVVLSLASLVVANYMSFKEQTKIVTITKRITSILVIYQALYSVLKIVLGHNADFLDGFPKTQSLLTIFCYLGILITPTIVIINRSKASKNLNSSASVSSPDLPLSVSASATPVDSTPPGLTSPTSPSSSESTDSSSSNPSSSSSSSSMASPPAQTPSPGTDSSLSSES